MKRTEHSLGFSLVELMVVLALIAALALLATPLMGRNSTLRNLNASARTIEGCIQQARLRAQRDNRPYYVDFGQDLNGDGQADCILWRDLGNPPLNQTLDLADNDGDGVPDEVVGSEALFLDTDNRPAYGCNYRGIALGPGSSGPASGPPNFPWLFWPAQFWDATTGAATGQRFAANPDGTCTTGSVFIAEATDPLAPQPTRATYNVLVSPAGSVQVWRWTAARALWERL